MHQSTLDVLALSTSGRLSDSCSAYAHAMQTTKSIGQRMQEIRMKAGLNQEQFGGLLGVGKQAVSAWEQDRNPAPVAAILLLSERGKVSADYILKGSKTETLTPIESQLLMFYRGMDEWMRDHLLSDASNFYNQSNPGSSPSNPFGKPR